MSKGLRIRKGATIKLEGAAEKIINDNVSSSTYALNPDDFFAMTPKMLLKEGEQVEASAPLFYASTILVSNLRILLQEHCKQLFVELNGKY